MFNCRNALTRSIRRHFSASANQSYDLVIVGGGPVGVALAAAVGASKIMRENLSVALVEAGDLSKTSNWSPQPSLYSNRVVTITNNTVNFLHNVGAWQHLDGTRLGPVEEIQAWDGISGARIQFDSDTYGGLANVTEVLNLQRALLRAVADQGLVNVFDKVTVERITPESAECNPWPLVHLSDGQILRARLLVGADGFNSPVRRFAGIDSYGWDYGARGVVATLNHVPKVASAFQGANSTAYQRFLSTGPIAFLPITAECSSLVWSATNELASALQTCGPQAFAHMINAAFRLPAVSLQYLNRMVLEAHRAGSPLSSDKILEEIRWREQSHSIDVHSPLSSCQSPDSMIGIPPEGANMVPPLVTTIQEGSIASFPLRFQHADSYLGEDAGARTALIGDAAHTIHPLAGQGLNLGLADAQVLASVLEEAVSVGGDLGAYSTLIPYARGRYLPNHLMMAGVDKLHKLYSTDLTPVVWARSVGLEVVNELSGLKSLFAAASGSKSKTLFERSPWEHAATAVEAASATLATTSTILGAVGRSVAGQVTWALNQRHR